MSNPTPMSISKQKKTVLRTSNSAARLSYLYSFFSNSSRVHNILTNPTMVTGAYCKAMFNPFSAIGYRAY